MLVKNCVLLAFCFALLAVAFPVIAIEPAKIDVLTYAGASNVPLYVAQDLGYFRREGLDVSLSIAHGAIDQMKRMMSGVSQVATTSLDTIVGITEGQGELPLPGFDLVAFAGVHRGTAYIVARPEIASLDQVKGKTICVDALGYAYGMVLYKALENHGLMPDRDYNIVAVGTSDNRLATMEAGKAAVCLLSPPQDSEAAARGYHVLGDMSSALGPLQVAVYAARKTWLQSHKSEAVAFIRALVSADDYIFRNRPGTIAILQKHVPDLDQSHASAIYAALTSKVGLERASELEIGGIRSILAIRSEFAKPPMNLTDPYKYIDTSYYRQAENLH